MFCGTCGKEIEDGSVFCGLCGASVSGDVPAEQSQQMQSVPPSAAVGPNQSSSGQNAAGQYVTGQYRTAPGDNFSGMGNVYGGPGHSGPAPGMPGQSGPVYGGPEPGGPPPKKKRKKGCLIAVIILLVILLGIGYLAASLLGLFGPRNLGVDYDENDYASAMEKIGTEIVYEDMSGEELREHTRELKRRNTQYPIADFEWIHEDYQRRQFELTSSEATALINEIAPAFFWFERVQIDVRDNGEVRAAGTLRLRKALQDHYPDLMDEVPFPVFEKVNLYARGGIEIKDNALTLRAEDFRTGAISGISTEMLNENARYFEPLYTSVPDLEIYSLEITDTGTIAVDALIPQRSTVRRIRP